MEIRDKKFGRLFLILFKLPITLIALGGLVFGFLCTGIFHNEIHMSTMDMSSASAQQDQQCCNIGPAHQFGSWKNIILVAPDKTRDTLTLLALGLILAFGYGWSSALNRKPHFDLDAGRLYVKENPDLILFNHLRLAFARGILNPKIY